MTANTAKTKPSRQQRKEQDSAETEAFKKEHPFEWMNLPLGDTEKDEIAENPITPERLWRLLDEVTYNSYKFGSSYDWVHKCHVVSITGVKLWREDYNLCFTSRHSELQIALAIAEYKWLRFIKSGDLARSEKLNREIFD